jgi:hypothetical protein
VNEAAVSAMPGAVAFTRGVRGDPAAFSAFGHSYFIIPNPLYGSWERSEGR